MIFVLDTSVFFLNVPLNGTCYTTPSVVAELKDLRSKARYETLLATGLIVREPAGEMLEAVDRAAEQTGDTSVLSGTDRDILALARELGGILVTDDFAVQNVAHRLGIEVHPIQQRRAAPRKWVFRCTGCGRYAEKAGICDICGSPIKRKLK
jgi:UPF0271 protein